MLFSCPTILCSLTERSILARSQMKPCGSHVHSSCSSLLYILCQKFSFFAFIVQKKVHRIDFLIIKHDFFWIDSEMGFYQRLSIKMKSKNFVSDLNFSLLRNASWWRHLPASVFLSNELKTSKKPFWCQTPQKITSSHKNGFERLHTFHDILYYSLTHFFSSFIKQFGNESPRYVLARCVILPELDFFSSPTSERFAKASKLKA